MTLPSLETIASYVTIVFAILGAITAAFWLSLVIWAFRDMRLRSRDPFAQILAAILVAALPFVGIVVYLILRPPETLAERYERSLEEEALLQEIEERPACPKCSRQVDGKWVICPYCHAQLQKQCPHCLNTLELAWTRCPFCAVAQPAQAPPFRVLRPVTIEAPAAIPAMLTGSENGAYRRRYRTAPVNGNGAARQPHAAPSKFIVGDTQPTVIHMPAAVQVASRNGDGENGSIDATIFREPEHKSSSNSK